MKPKLPKAEEVYPLLQEIDERRYYSNYGLIVETLESEYAEFLNVDKAQVVALQNATLGILGCVSQSKFHDWYVPNYTFAASGLAVLQAGKRLILTDVDAETFEIDAALIRNGLNLDENAFGIVAVMPFGASIDFEKYSPFENVVFDAAASIGSTIPDFSRIRESWSVVYSLHATKVLGCGEGAIVVCGSKKSAQSLRSWINFGFDGSRSSNIEGTNAKMPEVSAAYALTALRNSRVEFSEWGTVINLINSIDNSSSINTYINRLPGVRPYWIIDCQNSELKKSVIANLREQGIETRNWWPFPLSEMPAFRNVPTLTSVSAAERSVASQLASRHLGLPSWRGLREFEVSEIHNLVKSVLA